MATSLRIAFIHPELGMGGAERLVLDAAVCLQELGHQVTIFTTRRERSACFKEARDGSLDIRVHGGFLPAHIGQRLRAPCAIMRTAFIGGFAALSNGFDLIFVDLVPHVIPLLRLFSRAPVVFYCHYPDRLLAKKGGRIYRLYRTPIDRLEEFGIGFAGRVLVNSRFTAVQFQRAFRRLDAVLPEVLYPGVEITQCEEQDVGKSIPDDGSAAGSDQDIVLLAISRFERKKNLGLILAALACLRNRLRPEVWSRTRLVLVGGFDARWQDERDVLSELRAEAEHLALQEHVRFELSCSDEQRANLLSYCLCVVYTPVNEHFGLVPIEAMAAGRPVVAVNSGGPLETIRHGETGFLCDPTPEAFAGAVARLMAEPELADRIGRAGRRHVAEHFSRDAFGARLETIMQQLVRGSSWKPAASRSGPPG
jgi:alpha-1,3/alpha-1,6-mannosyltransferase